MRKTPVSVCMIAGAEAHRIARSLESVAQWTSEIIVVLNDEVRDGTEEIARSFGARVCRESWKGHVAQKNSALQKAGQPWILGLDADEVVSLPLRDEIARIFEPSSKPPGFAAYSFPRLTYYCGRWIRHGDWYPDRQVRLSRRDLARWTGIDPHDKLMVQGRVGKLSSDLHHHSCESINRQIGKVVAYSDDFARHALAQKQSCRAFDLAVRPPWRFVRSYFFRLGFLDGWQGWYIAWVTAFLCVTRYAKVREVQCQIPGANPSA